MNWHLLWGQGYKHFAEQNPVTVALTVEVFYRGRTTFDTVVFTMEFLCLGDVLSLIVTPERRRRYLLRQEGPRRGGPHLLNPDLI